MRRSPEAEALRDHSRRCAAAAMLLAEKTGALDPDEAYTAGLLHDLGEALLRSLFPEEAENISWLGHPFAVEKEVAAFGVDHAQVGQWILDACGVPATRSFAVQAHHDLDHVNDPAALLLQVADAVAGANDSSEMARLDRWRQTPRAPASDARRPRTRPRADHRNGRRGGSKCRRLKARG